MKLFKSFRKQKKDIEKEVITLASEEQALVQTLGIPARKAEFDPETSPFAFIKFTFKVEEEEETLIAERYYNNQELVIYYKDLEADPPFEKIYDYDEENRLIEEVEISEGQEVTRDVFEYRPNVTIHYLFISGELFEIKIKKEQENGHVEATFQEGVEVNRKEFVGDEFNFEVRFFEEQEMIEYQVHTYDATTKTTTGEVYDANESLEMITSKTYNDAGLLTKEQQHDNQQHLITEVTYEYNALNLPIKEVNTQDMLIQEYDERQNLIKLERRMLTGQMIEFAIYKLDQDDYEIEESGFKMGQDYRHKHVYEFKSKERI